jgi:PRTase ComF-like
MPGPFDAALYSRYKYGSIVAAGWFARALGQAFLDRYPRLAHQPRLLMASSPYRRVPTAANALAVRFAAVLNAGRAGRGLPPAPQRDAAARLAHIRPYRRAKRSAYRSYGRSGHRSCPRRRARPWIRRTRNLVLTDS